MDLPPNNSWLIIKVMKELTIGLSSRMTGALLLKRCYKKTCAKYTFRFYVNGDQPL